MDVVGYGAEVVVVVDLRCAAGRAAATCLINPGAACLKPGTAVLVLVLGWVIVILDAGIGEDWATRLGEDEGAEAWKGGEEVE